VRIVTRQCRDIIGANCRLKDDDEAISAEAKGEIVDFNVTQLNQKNYVHNISVVGSFGLLLKLK
jgi:hypothetical protein